MLISLIHIGRGSRESAGFQRCNTVIGGLFELPSDLEAQERERERESSRPARPSQLCQVMTIVQQQHFGIVRVCRAHCGHVQRSHPVKK